MADEVRKDMFGVAHIQVRVSDAYKAPFGSRGYFGSPSVGWGGGSWDVVGGEGHSVEPGVVAGATVFVVRSMALLNLALRFCAGGHGASTVVCCVERRDLKDFVPAFWLVSHTRVAFRAQAQS